MSTTQNFYITLPNDMADAVKAKVEAGVYATESDVIRHGLRGTQYFSLSGRTTR